MSHINKCIHTKVVRQISLQNRAIPLILKIEKTKISVL